MTDPKPQASPQPNAPSDPSVYGGKWGKDGAQDGGVPPPDRPTPIDTPDEPQGTGNASDPQP